MATPKSLKALCKKEAQAVWVAERTESCLARAFGITLERARYIIEAYSLKSYIGDVEQVEIDPWDGCPPSLREFLDRPVYAICRDIGRYGKRLR